MGPLPIRWEWKCDDPKFAKQVDAPQPSDSDHDICTPDRTGVAKVTYAVMSNAVDASVKVRLLLNDDEPSPPTGVYGEITAYTGGFEKGSRLFKRTQSTQQPFSSTDSRALEMDLARSVVAVPCDWELRIVVALTIETSNTTDAPKKLNTTLIFANGASTDKKGQVEANVTWYPEPEVKNIETEGKNNEKKRKRGFTGVDDERVNKLQKTFGGQQPEKFGQDKQIHVPPILSGSEKDQSSKTSEVITGPDETGESSRQKQASTVISDLEETAESSLTAEAKLETGPQTVEVPPYIIGDAESFRGFITDVRGVLADNPDHGDILDRHPTLSSTREHPLLAKHHEDQPARLLGIKLQSENDSSATTLFVRYTNLHCLGFRNQDGVCYELTNPEGWKLPAEWNAVPLDWGITYESILLNASDDDDEELVRILDGAKLGKAFVANAAGRLSSSIHPDAEVDGMLNARLALAGLEVMFIESARMNPLRDTFVSGWDTGVTFTKLLMMYMQHWELISDALLGWKDESYHIWTIHPKLAAITGVKTYEDALNVVNLVRNFTTKQRQVLHQEVYGAAGWT